MAGSKIPIWKSRSAPTRSSDDRDYRCAQNENKTRRIHRPDEQRQSEPGHSGRAHFVNGDDEVQARQDGRKTGNENANCSQHHIRICIPCTERRVERPPCIHAACHDSDQRERRADHEHVPTRQIKPGKRKILSPDHERNQKVSQRCRYRRNQKEKYHHDTVQCEDTVVHVVTHHLPGWRDKLEANQNGKDAAQAQRHT